MVPLTSNALWRDIDMFGYSRRGITGAVHTAWLADRRFESFQVLNQDLRRGARVCGVH